MSKKHTEELTKWINQAGIKLHENLSIVKVQKSYQLVASKPIDESETLISYPDKTIICLDNSDFAEIQFTAKQNELLAEEVTPYLAQTLIFLYEFLKPECSIKFEKGPSKKKKKKNKKAAVDAPVKGKKSLWGEFLKHISELDDLPTPANWSKEDRDLLNGTSLQERVSDLEVGLKEEFDNVIVPFLTDSSISCPSDKLSFEVYKKIRSYVLAYSWATGGEEITYSPLAELFSYSSHKEKLNGTIDLSNEEAISIVSTKQLQANEQVCCSSSGARTAETIYKLGFVDHQPNEACPLGTEDDLVEIEPEFLFELLEKDNGKDEELLATRSQLIGELGLLEDVFEIEASGEIPNDLLLAVKLIFMDNQEFELYESEMKKSGFLFGDDDLEDLDDEEAAALEAEFNSDDEESIPKTLANPDNKAKETAGGKGKGKDKKEKESEGESDEEVDISDGSLNFSDLQEEELPAIADEKGVYNFLELVFQQKLDKLNSATTGLVDYKKPGVIRKPQLLAEYLKTLEKSILQKALSNVKEHIKTLSGASATKEQAASPKKVQVASEKQSPKKNNKKRANEKKDSGAPPAKKSKK